MSDDLVSNNDRNLFDQPLVDVALPQIVSTAVSSGLALKLRIYRRRNLNWRAPNRWKESRFYGSALLASQCSRLARYGPDLVQGIPGAPATRLIRRLSERYFAHAVISNIHS